MDEQEERKISEFVEKNGHVLKNLEVVERRGSFYAVFDGSEGKKIVLMPLEGKTLCVDSDGMVKISCDVNDNYDPVVGVSLAEKKMELKRKEKRSFRRYKDALNDLDNLIAELAEGIA